MDEAVTVYCFLLHKYSRVTLATWESALSCIKMKSQPIRRRIGITQGRKTSFM